MKARALILCALVLLAASCGEKEIDLGSGFTYVQLDGSNWAVVHGSAVIVLPNVVNCKLVRGVIVGKREEPHYIDVPEPFSEKYGYFVYDIETKSLTEGLTKEKFVETLGRRGIVTDFP